MCWEMIHGRRRLRGGGTESQFFMLNVIGNGRGFATFDQIGDSLAIALGVPKKLDAELVILVPPHDGNFDG